jgi:2',3'-cyclic-nucleotide 2'-phosphodiesterase/3'-nucleotidase
VLHSGLDEPSAFDAASATAPGENVAARVAREVPGIDVIVFGHSHRELADSTIGQTLLVQPRNWATSVAAVQLSLERRANRWSVTARHGKLIPAAGHVEQAAVLEATKQGHAKAVAWVGRVIGSTPVTWRGDSARVMDTPLTDMLLEVERRASGADLAASPAYDLDAMIPAGSVTVAQISRLYPYENTLRAVRITGRQLRAYLEFSARYFRTWGTPDAVATPVDPSIPGYNFDIVAGVEYVIDVSRPIGERITRLAFRGRPVNDSDTFTLALNNYRQTGGGGFAMLRNAPVVYDRTEDIRQLLIDEVVRRGTIRPEDFFTRNWQLEPPDAAVAAYRAMTRPSQNSGPRLSPRRELRNSSR